MDDGSYAIQFGQHCDRCRTLNRMETWVVVDVGERGELADAVRQKRLRRFTCTKCSAVGDMDQSLLLVRRTGVPELIFGWASWTDPERSQEQLFAALSTAGRRMGEAWSDDWRERLLPAPFGLLFLLIDRNVEQDLERFDEASVLASQPEIAAYRGWLGQVVLNRDPERVKTSGMLLLQAETWSECKRVLEAHPELLTEQADGFLSTVLEVVREEHKDEQARIAEERQQLVRRCREVGITPAIVERQNELARARRR